MCISGSFRLPEAEEGEVAVVSDRVQFSCDLGHLLFVFPWIMTGSEVRPHVMNCCNALFDCSDVSHISGCDDSMFGGMCACRGHRSTSK